ncbi:hypothetical protein NX059_002464 [Plenodomus lindquistii]|nr:hypothetical protein NX059_002464 [Plenodomus lindquistii]
MSNCSKIPTGNVLNSRVVKMGPRTTPRNKGTRKLIKVAHLRKHYTVACTPVNDSDSSEDDTSITADDPALTENEIQTQLNTSLPTDSPSQAPAIPTPHDTPAPNSPPLQTVPPIPSILDRIPDEIKSEIFKHITTIPGGLNAQNFAQFKHENLDTLTLNRATAVFARQSFYEGNNVTLKPALRPSGRIHVTYPKPHSSQFIRHLTLVPHFRKGTRLFSLWGMRDPDLPHEAENFARQVRFWRGVASGELGFGRLVVLRFRFEGLRGDWVHAQMSRFLQDIQGLEPIVFKVRRLEIEINGDDGSIAAEIGRFLTRI